MTQAVNGKSSMGAVNMRFKNQMGDTGPLYEILHRLKQTHQFFR